MKPNSDLPDPFREMLTDAAAHLPAMAAQAAREASARRARHRRQLAQAACVALLGMVCWQTYHFIRTVPKGGGLAQTTNRQSAVSRPGDFALVRSKAETSSMPLPSPPGATQEQLAILESARGLPLLLVMDGSGKPPRIVVVER